MKPRALDLFCGAGGASMGLSRAGFDVVGVDKDPKPEYPFQFFQADALTFPLDGFDFIWASPPCQAFSTATRDKSRHLNLIPAIRERLKASGAEWVIENVLGSPLENPIMLCGAMFDLGVIRHRLFESSFWIDQPTHVPHKGSIVTGEYVTVAGSSNGIPSWTIRQRVKLGLPKYFPGEGTLPVRSKAMGIDWMKNKTLVQAIPPAYSEFLGREAMEHIWK